MEFNRNISELRDNLKNINNKKKDSDIFKILS